MKPDASLQIKTVYTQAAEAMQVKNSKTLWQQDLLPEHAYLVVAYLDYAVMTGRLRDGKFEWPESDTAINDDLLMAHLQRVRVFDESRELLVWKSGSGLWKRLRQDSGDVECSCIDVNQILYGTGKVGDTARGFTEIREDRGTHLFIPGSYNLPSYEWGRVPATEESKDRLLERRQRIALCTRNYIQANSLGQATFFDCRFVKFIGMQ